MVRTSQSNLDDGSRSVISWLEQYQRLEKKRSFTPTPPCVVTKLVRVKKSAITTNDDVASPLSTASVATSPALPLMEHAWMKELLEPTLENNDEDDNSNDDGNSSINSIGVGSKYNKVAAVAANATNDKDANSNDDGKDGGGSGGKCNDDNYDDNDNEGGEYSPTGQGLYYSDDNAFLDDVFDNDYIKRHFLTIPDEAACDCNCNRIMGEPQPPDQDATDLEKRSYKAKQKAITDANCSKLLTALTLVDMNVLPQRQVVTEHTGDQFPHICLMNVVENSPLMSGHTFAKKDTMMIHIGE